MRRFSLSNFNKFPNCSGISPVRLFRPRSIHSSSVRLPISFGISPVKLRLSKIRVLTLPSVFNVIPAQVLISAFKSQETVQLSPSVALYSAIKASRSRLVVVSSPKTFKLSTIIELAGLVLALNINSNA